MKHEVPTTPGIEAAGGFYVGRISIGGTEYALIVAPKAEGEHKATEWNDSYDDIPQAKSFCDGLANTNAMAEAGSDLAKWARGLRIGGFDDWYLPSQDELELCYRNLKPGTDENSLYGRSGINVSAVPPTYPYTATTPAQTQIEAFRSGGAEAFDESWYWSSTQHAAFAGYAWSQGFGGGFQDDWSKDGSYRARAVRRLAI